MRVRTRLDVEDLEMIAEDLGVRALIGRTEWRPRLRRNDITVRFVPGDDKVRYRRVSQSVFGPERRVHALCYHGFLDVFREIFRWDPEARITTAFADWRSAADLEARKAEAWTHPVGSLMYPQAFGELCRCPRAGGLE